MYTLTEEQRIVVLKALEEAERNAASDAKEGIEGADLDAALYQTIHRELTMLPFTVVAVGDDITDVCVEWVEAPDAQSAVDAFNNDPESEDLRTHRQNMCIVSIFEGHLTDEGVNIT